MTADKPIPDATRLEAMRALMVPQFEMVDSVARALMARDERAAKIVEGSPFVTPFGTKRIATAIRNGGEA